MANATALLAREPAGLVLVTSFSNRRGDSHGTFVGDLSALVSVSTAPAPPTLYVRLEDLAPAGIADWGDLSKVRSGPDRLGRGRLLAGILRQRDRHHPRQGTRSKAVILGAHLDSPNSPGAMDNGSGTVVLLEVARVLDAARLRPPVDLVLCWFGSHERGLYGSSNFLATHQELVDRTLAMLQVDCLSRPLDGITRQPLPGGVAVRAVRRPAAALARVPIPSGPRPGYARRSGSPRTESSPTTPASSATMCRAPT